MNEHGNGAPSMPLLGLHGVVVLAAAERTGEVGLLVETTEAGDRLRALRRGRRAARAAAGDGVGGTCRLPGGRRRWCAKRLWCWREPDRAQRTWSETSAADSAPGGW